jgi:SAM-dependent methyltransferase
LTGGLSKEGACVSEPMVEDSLQTDPGPQAIWNRIFSDRDKAGTTGGRYFYQLALKGIRLGERICDAGCGYAFYLDELMERCGPDGLFMGIDFSSVALAENMGLARRYGNAHYIQADLLHLPMVDGSVDRIFCAETLPYLLEDVERALEELARVSKGEVVFSLHTRAIYEIKGTKTEFRGNIVIEQKAGAKPPRRVFDEEEIGKLVENTGCLKLESMRPFQWGDIYEVPDGMEWPWFLPPRERIALYYISCTKTNGNS